MRGWQTNRGIDSGLRTGGSVGGRWGLKRKYRAALLMYAVLAVLVWFTMDAGKIPVMGRMVEMRLVPLVVLGGLALRTALALEAERLRRDGEEDKGSS
jgi:hypothetical protein